MLSRLALERPSLARNMLEKFTNLATLKLSGWSNTDAYCRESQGGYTVRDDVRAGMWEVHG